MNATALAALYYPFSRSIDPCSTKQMLLVFDRIHFLDPVDDDAWRARLMRQMEGANSPQFKSYREIAEALPTLIQEKIVVREDPTRIEALSHSTWAASAIEDLRDEVWARSASTPERYQMPHYRRNGSASWEIFRPKLRAETLLGDEASNEPGFMRKLAESLQNCPRFHQQQPFPFVEETEDLDTLLHQLPETPRPLKLPPPDLGPPLQLRVEVWRESKNKRKHTRIIKL